MKQVTTKLPKILKDELKKVAESRGTSMVQFIRDAISAYIKGEWG